MGFCKNAKFCFHKWVKKKRLDASKQPAENLYLVDFYMLKFFMIRPASVSLHPCDLCTLEDLQRTRPLVSPHSSIHTCGICIRHSQMWKIFWELQISQYDISESLNTPKSVMFGVCSNCQIAPLVSVVRKGVAITERGLTADRV